MAPRVQAPALLVSLLYPTLVLNVEESGHMTGAC